MRLIFNVTFPSFSRVIRDVSFNHKDRFMQYEILARPAAAVAKLTLDSNESITCEVGAMIAM